MWTSRLRGGSEPGCFLYKNLLTFVKYIFFCGRMKTSITREKQVTMKKKGKIFIAVVFLLGVIALFAKEDKGKEKNGEEVFEEIIKSENNDIEIKEQETKTYIKENLSEEEFKDLCSEIIYNEISEQSIGEYVYKDLFNWQIKESSDRYLCSAIEDFIEDLKGYQKTYRNYKVIDCRFDNSFPIENDDIIRVYGIVESVSQSYFTGGYNPTIKAYYIEYIRKYGKEPENKTIEEIKEERIAANEKIRQEIEYRNSLNTDYNGETKNIEGMQELPLEEYISYCDKLNYSNLTNGEDLTGRYVAIHVQASSHKIFKNDDGKKKWIGEWVEPESICNDFWYCKLYSERAEDYIMPFAHTETLYFLNVEDIEPDKIKEESNLIIYGQIIDFDLNNYGDMEILVRYYEFE